ncbi:hypothetical protein [Hyphococcus sp.]|uniref:hypothetical protein n=1 Tax=Hyphococcus sp. TaxID=2038636 RepID=UPI003CCB766E
MRTLCGGKDRQESIIFQERQGTPLLTATGIIVMMLLLTVVAFFYSPDEYDRATNLMLVAIIAPFAALVIFQKKITTIDKHGLSVRQHIFLYYNLPFEDVARAEPGSYYAALKEHGRMALFSSWTRISHDAGVLIYLNNDKLSFVSSKQPAKLASAINTGRVEFERRKYD